MLRNYLIIALRNFSNNKFYTALNVIGLSIGITCSILILLWVADELSFDKFIPRHDKLYQVWSNAEFDNTINSWKSVPLPIYQALKTAHANISKTAVSSWNAPHLLTVGETRMNRNGLYVSEEFLEMFEFPMVYGDPARALDEPTSIVLTESTANALFGNEDPLNKTIRVDNAGDLQVVAILRDIPKNSSLEFDFLIPWSYHRQISPWVIDNEDNWGNYSFQVFVELNDPVRKDDVEAKIRLMLQEHKEDEIKPELFLYPMARWRLYSNFENGVEKGGMSDFVQLFSLIAVLILLIACINFMNMATARSEKRAKEVGIRKTVGSTKTKLVFQFLTESILISVFAFILAIIASETVLPFYNDLVQKQLRIPIETPAFWVAAFVLILLTGLLSGGYPAFYLSSFKPIKVLKGRVMVGRKASWPRKALVTVQFMFAIFLLESTLLIYQQLQLVKNRQLGYNQSNLIMLELNDELKKNYQPLKTDLMQSGLVESMTISNSPVTDIHSNNFLGWPGKPEEEKVLFTTITCKYDYAKTMGIKIIEGRDFSQDFPSDSTAIIVNKAAMDLMDLNDPIGTELDLWGKKRTLVGIVDNVLMGSPFQEVKPLFMIMDDWGGYVTMRIPNSNDLSSRLRDIESKMKKYNPAYPFDYKFADVEFQKKFSTIELTNQLSGIFAALSIFITGLGLLGLAAFTAEQRTKEIGVRRVFGAAVSDILFMISKDFAYLVLLAFIITSPISWWLLYLYLQRYPIRIDIEYWIFPVTGFIVLIFSLLIVIFQAYRAVRLNPATSLREE